METLLPIDSCHVSRHAKPKAPTGEVSIRSECISREIEAWTTRGDHVTPRSTDTCATIALSHVPDTFAGATYPTTTAPEPAALRAAERLERAGRIEGAAAVRGPDHDARGAEGVGLGRVVRAD